MLGGFILGELDFLLVDFRLEKNSFFLMLELKIRVLVIKVYCKARWLKVAVITCVESIVAIVTFGHEWMGGVVEVGRRATKVVKVGLVHD